VNVTVTAPPTRGVAGCRVTVTVSVSPGFREPLVELRDSGSVTVAVQWSGAPAPLSVTVQVSPAVPRSQPAAVT
jgi:hypothetical protein